MNINRKKIMSIEVNMFMETREVVKDLLDEHIKKQAIYNAQRNVYLDLVDDLKRTLKKGGKRIKIEIQIDQP